MFRLCSTSYGATSLNITWTEALDLDVLDSNLLLMELEEVREKEAAAYKKVR